MITLLEQLDITRFDKQMTSDKINEEVQRQCLGVDPLTSADVVSSLNIAVWDAFHPDPELDDYIEDLMGEEIPGVIPITEIQVPDDIPAWAEDSLKTGMFLVVAIERVDGLTKALKDTEQRRIKAMNQVSDLQYENNALIAAAAPKPANQFTQEVIGKHDDPPAPGAQQNAVLHPELHDVDDDGLSED